MEKQDIVNQFLRSIASKGGKNRWSNMTPEQRTAAVKRMHAKRWPKKPSK